MKRISRIRALALGLALAGASISCGGGRTAIVGLGNGGNKIFEGEELAEELAEMIAENPAMPEVTDELLAEVYRSIVSQARDGDARAALIVFRVAEAQREDDEG